MTKTRRICSVVAFVAIFSTSAWSQGQTGTLAGTVLDAAGAVVPGATVTAINAATGTETVATTTSAGVYTLPYLPPGNYTLRVSAPGFRTSSVENVTLRVGQRLDVPVQLELGQVTEQVTVSADAALLETGSAEIGRYITESEYESWPILVADGQRQIQSFIFNSLPGTTGSTFEGSINGGQQYSHEILIEGIPLGRMDLSGGNNNEMSPSAEAVGEFKLHTGAMGAQYNGGQTAVANFAIKSGTNELHGSGFYYGQNEFLNANTYANNSRGRDKSPFRQHNWGYSIGGPVYIPKVYDGRNKTFFFHNFEKTDRSEFNVSGFNTTLAPQAFHRGDFSSLFDPSFTGNPSSGTVVGQDALGRDVRFGQIYDPTTTRTVNGQIVRDPFPGNMIPTSRFSNVSSNIINDVGLVTPDLNSLVRNTATIGTCCPYFDLWIAMIKGDHAITDNHRLSGLYNHEYRNRNNRSGESFLPVPGLPTQNWNNQYTPSRLVRLSLTSTLTPTMLNRVSAGYNRFRNSNQSVFVNEDWASAVGLRGVSPAHFPRMNFAGNEWQGGTIAPIGSPLAGENINGSYVITDDLTIIRGKHSFRIGYDYRRYFYNQRNLSSSGTFEFRANQTFLPQFSDATGHGFASFVLGAAQSARRSVTILNTGHRQPQHAVYFMDDWKVTPKLTLNLGVRWEIIPPFYEVTDRMSMVDINEPNPQAANLPGAFVFRDRFQSTNWKQLSPRTGFAYQATDKLVVRGGYSITNMPPIRNDWGFGGFTTGWDASIPLIAGTSPSGFVDDPAFNLDQPYPALTTPLPNTNPGQQLFTGVTTTAPDSNKLAYTQNWNFTVQYELPARHVLEVAYIGNKGTNLWALDFGDLNAIPANFLSMGDILRERVGNYPQFKPYPSFPDNQTVAQALRPYPQYTGLSDAYYYAANSLYNSMQITLTRHFAGGFGILTGYTWSKALGQTDNARGENVVQDVFNRSLERSVTQYHRPHQVKITWIYEIPVGSGKAVDLGALNYVLGGWKFSGVHRYQSGAPIQLSQSGLNTPVGFGDIRPDVLAGADQTLVGAPDELDFFQGTPYLNSAAFTEVPQTAQGVPLRVGTAPRYLPSVRGPHSFTEDMRASKIFPLWGEASRLEFGIVAVNPLNRHNREFVTTNISSPDFGKLRIAGAGQRTLQLEARIEF